MNVLILAAGQGNRLKPLTNNNPKCLVKVLNKSILDHQLNIFKKFNFDKINIVAGYKANKLKIKILKYLLIKNLKIQIWYTAYFVPIIYLEKNLI